MFKNKWRQCQNSKLSHSRLEDDAKEQNDVKLLILKNAQTMSNKFKTSSNGQTAQIQNRNATNRRQQLKRLLESISMMKSLSNTSLTDSEWSDEDRLITKNDNTKSWHDEKVGCVTKTISEHRKEIVEINKDLNECYTSHHIKTIPMITPSSVLKANSKCQNRQLSDSSFHLSDENDRSLTSDVTIYLRDQTFLAHKLILYNKSGYFRSVILKNKGKTLTNIKLDPIISISTFKILYEYMYTGEIKITHDNFQEVLEVSDLLLINGAPHKMLEFLEKFFDISNVLLLNEHAKKISDLELKTKTNFLLTSNFMQISEQLEFLKVPLETFIELLDDDGIIVTSELNVFRTAMRWLAYDWERRKCSCLDVIKKVRLTLMTHEELLICYREMERLGIMELGNMKDVMISILSYKMGQQIGFHLHLSNDFNFRRRNSMAEQMDNLINVQPFQDDLKTISNSPTKSLSLTNISDISLQVKNTPSILILGGSDFIHCCCTNNLRTLNTIEENCTSMYQYVPGHETWKFIGFMPHSWHHPGAVQSRQLTYICGGCIPSDNLIRRSPQATSRTWCFNATDRNWHRLPDMAIARIHHSVLIWQEKIFSFGGIGKNNEFHDTVECYDPLIGKWRMVTTLPQAKLGMAACFYQDLFWTCGGIIRSNNDLVNGGTITDTVNAYNPKTKRWHTLKSLRLPRAFASLAVLNGRIVIIGGIGPRSEKAGVSVSMSDVDILDIQKNEWHHLTDLFTPRHCCSTIVIGRYLYVIGGISSDGEALSSIEILDSLRNHCPTFGINLPTKLAGMGSVVLPPAYS